jgi:hypothetical protein
MRLTGTLFKRSGILLLGIATVVAAVGSADTQKQKNITAAEMHEDLRFFARELPKRHKNAFHFTPEDRFRAAIDELDAHLDTMNEDAFYVGLMRLTAMVGDAHTHMNMQEESIRVFPLGIVHFAEAGYRVVSAGPGAEKALGARILKIDRTPEELFFSILSPLATQNENLTYVPALVDVFLRDARVLHGAGIVDKVEAARFTLEDDAGQQFSLDISSIAVEPGKPLSLAPFHKATHFTEISEPMRNPSPSFSYTYVPEARTVYADVRSMADVNDPAKELFAFIRGKQPDKLIIDLRRNPGGDYFHGLHGLIEPIAKLASINQKGHLFVLIGPLTGSAAIINSSQFHTMTQAILVGQPIGAKPTEYAEHKTMELPRTRFIVGYSVEFYDFAFNKENVVSPDFEIKATWDDIKNGGSPVIDWCLAYKTP